MKNAWFVLLLFASILINAAIVDSARLAPVATGAPAACPPPAIEARGDATPARPVTPMTIDAARLHGCSSGDVEGPAPVAALRDPTARHLLRR